MPATRCADMLAKQLAGLRLQQADVEIIPLHIDAAPNAPGRRAVVGPSTSTQPSRCTVRTPKR
jgi:hypothetical protein